MFIVASVGEYEKSQKFKSISNIFYDLKNFEWNNMIKPRIKFKERNELIISDELKYIMGIISLNFLVTLIWKIKPAEMFMWRYFTNSFASSNF